MHWKPARVSYHRSTRLILALLLFLPVTARAHGLDDLLLYVGVPLVFIIVILTPFIKWCSLRWLVAESVHAPLIPISVMELCGCVSTFYVVASWDVVDRVCRFYGYETGQVPGTARIGASALIWLSANILINWRLVKSPNGSTGPILSRRKQVLISVVFGFISPGLFWLFTIFSEWH
jgi:hypothetical protein